MSSRYLRKKAIKMSMKEIECNCELTYSLEESYISSRYISRKYGPEIDAKTLEFGRKLLEVFKWLEKST